ncbi:glycoside hydrolase family 71 protein [Actinomadura sp. DC4]|uniref:glycoside hydrolase family 71 protein n=1 Tax=Actinomadura sp. DC4 TaxID=3055069 RepID=UPI0025AF1AC3|nr:glycoside hydrolase family 71 protein [Actinomadura sp. DC4]MDN3357478.1 glycoside hydrolase family 71 protein [Actinomadura sp. DC4]
MRNRTVALAAAGLAATWFAVSGTTHGHGEARSASLAAADGTAANTGPLPFELPAQSVLKGSAKKVFAHYFTPYPVSLDDKAASADYYTRNYLSATGEGGIHAAYGGLLRDRPPARDPIGTGYQLKDMETEVSRATAAGLDGFTADLLSVSSSSANWARVKTLIQAAAATDPNFKIMLMPDMNGLASTDSDTLAAAVASVASSPAVYHLADGRLVVSPFKAEARTPAWWTTWMNTMKTTYGITVALVPCFVNAGSNMDAFAPISYGLSNWGNRNPAANASLSTNITKAHNLGKPWMQPVSVQDERPNQGVYDEANNTENLRLTWTAAIGGADWVQIPTWNDYSEGAQLSPSARHGYTYLDISSYYLTRYKTGAYPAITKDVAYLTHRIQPAAATPTTAETKLMALRGGSSPARDDVEVLTMLTASATVTATIGGVAHTYTAPAGVHAELFPLKAGVNTVSVSRAGAVTPQVTSPFTVTSTPTVQDEQYYAVDSGR